MDGREYMQQNHEEDTPRDPNIICPDACRQCMYGLQDSGDLTCNIPRNAEKKSCIENKRFLIAPLSPSCVRAPLPATRVREIHGRRSQFISQINNVRKPCLLQTSSLDTDGG